MGQLCWLLQKNLITVFSLLPPSTLFPMGILMGVPSQNHPKEKQAKQLVKCCTISISATVKANGSELARTLKESFKQGHSCTGEVLEK